MTASAPRGADTFPRSRLVPSEPNQPFSALLGPSSLARTALDKHEVAGLRISGLCDRHPFALVTSTLCGLLSDAVRVTSAVWSAEPLTTKTLGTSRVR